MRLSGNDDNDDDKEEENDNNSEDGDNAKGEELRNKSNYKLPNAVEQWSTLSSNVPSDVVSGPKGIISRLVRVMLSRICQGKSKRLESLNRSDSNNN